MSTLGGHALLGATLSDTATTTKIGTFAASLDKTYGRLHTVVAAADGSLWLTTSNRDGQGTPVATDERVIRIVPSGASTSPPAV